jgi:hypothetical protein
LIAFAIFHCLAPTGTEERFLIPIFPILVLAIAAGVNSIISLREILRPTLRWITPVLLAALFFTGVGFASYSRPVYGYARVIDNIIQDTTERDLVMLVSSDTSGEGMFVSEVALRDRVRNCVVLRASKVLSSSEWSGYTFSLRFADKETVMTFLKSIPVDYIVLDATIPRSRLLPDRRQLAETLESYPGEYALVNKLPLVRCNTIVPDAIHIYRRQSVNSPRPRIISVPMDFMLGKTLKMALPRDYH